MENMDWNSPFGICVQVALLLICLGTLVPILMVLFAPLHWKHVERKARRDAEKREAELSARYSGPITVPKLDAAWVNIDGCLIESGYKRRQINAKHERAIRRYKWLQAACISFIVHAIVFGVIVRYC